MGTFLLLWVALVAMYEMFLAIAWSWVGVAALSVRASRGFAAAVWGCGLSLAIWAAIVGSLSGITALMSHMSGRPVLALALGPVLSGLLLVVLKPVRKFRDAKLASYGYNPFPWSFDDVTNPGHVHRRRFRGAALQNANNGGNQH